MELSALGDWASRSLPAARLQRPYLSPPLWPLHWRGKREEASRNELSLKMSSAWCTVTSNCTHIEGGPGWAKDHSQLSEILSRYFEHTIFVRAVLFAVLTFFKIKAFKT